jgi:hypothetical protein
MLGVEIKVDGVQRALRAYLVQLDGVAHEALVDAGSAAIDAAREAIERATTRRTGALEDSWHAGWPDRDTRSVSNFAPHAQWIDEGTKPHRIEARRAKVLAFQFAGGMMFRRAVNHPGTKPRPFVAIAMAAGQVALQTSAQEGVDRIARSF